MLAGCGGGSSGPSFPTIGAARTFEIADFEPAGADPAGQADRISFVIRQPDGQPLTTFKRGAGPHTGVHLIFVRDDLATIIHKHPPVAADGTIRETLTFPDPGPLPARRRRLPRERAAAELPALPPGSGRGQGRRPSRCRRRRRSSRGDGYRFAIQGKPKLKAIQATLLTIDVTDAQGRPAAFTPYFGALAHAIFFRKGSLDYFHTHVCAPGASGCTSYARRRAGHRHVGEAGPADGRRARSRRRARGACSSRRRSAAAW